MRQAAYLSGYGRGAFGVVAAACLGLALAGCSSGVSRFDFPAFNLTSNDTPAEGGNADLASTSSLPPVLPEELVYSSGEGAPPRLTRATLPPPDYTPRPAAYSPAPSGRVAAAEANYPAPAAPRAEPAVLRPKFQGAHVKVEKGDTLSTLSRRYGVPVEKIMAANNLPDGRLSIGQELIIPGAKEPKVVAEAAPVEAAPPAPGQSTYKVQKGDTPHSIADKLGVSEKALIERNKLTPSNLRIGQVLVVPGKSAKPVVAAKDETPPLAEPAIDTAPNVRKVKTMTIPAPGHLARRRGRGPGDARHEICRQDARQRGERHSRFARGHRPGQPAHRQQRPAADARADVRQQLPLAGERAASSPSSARARTAATMTASTSRSRKAPR